MDITAAIEMARTEATRYALSDPTYSELMATYVELGELLDSGRSDATYEQQVHDLMGKLIDLGKAQTLEMEEAWALWCSRNMMPLAYRGGARGE